MGALDSVPDDFLRNFHLYRIAAVLLSREEGHSWTVTVTLERNAQRLVLHFKRVEGFAIDEGFPERSSGLVIHDLSDRGLEHARVLVGTSGSGPGLRLFAASVTAETGAPPSTQFGADESGGNS